MYNLDIPIKAGRSKLREEFQRNSHIRDPRVIDMLVIKVYMKLVIVSHVNPPSLG